MFGVSRFGEATAAGAIESFAGYVLASLLLIIIFGFSSRRFKDGLVDCLNV